MNFERISTALDPGERLYLADNFGSEYDARRRHPLEDEFGLPAWRILDLISEARRLKVAVRGSVAEEYLRRSFQLNPYQPEVAGELGRMGVVVQIPRKRQKNTKGLDKLLERKD